MQSVDRLPAPPRIPSDALFLLTYVAPASNRVQQNRVAMSAAREMGIDTESVTNVEEL